MPTVTLTFRLPVEEDAYTYATHGAALHSAVWNLREWLRCQVKYAGLPATTTAIFEQVRGQLFSLLDEQGLAGDFE